MVDVDGLDWLLLFVAVLNEKLVATTYYWLAYISCTAAWTVRLGSLRPYLPMSTGA